MIQTRIVPILFILGAIGLFFGYVNPTYTGQIADAKNQIQSYDSALAAAALFTKKENSLIAQRNAIPAQSLSNITSYLPDGVDNIQLILDLNALAARSGITLSNFTIQNNSSDSSSSGGAKGATGSTAMPGGLAGSTPSPQPTGSGAQQMQVGAVPGGSALPLQSTSLTNSLDLSVSASGTYAAFQTFLTSAEQSLRPLDITKISLKYSKTGIYTYTMTFRIYWLK